MIDILNIDTTVLILFLTTVLKVNLTPNAGVFITSTYSTANQVF